MWETRPLGGTTRRWVDIKMHLKETAWGWGWTGFTQLMIKTSNRAFLAEEKLAVQVTLLHGVC